MPRRPHLITLGDRERRLAPVRGRGVVVSVLGMSLPALLLLGGCAVSVDAPDASSSTEQACRTLIRALPDQVADQSRRDVSEPSRGAAWGDPAIVVTCGVPRPDDLTSTSTCLEANGIGWAVPADQETERPGDLRLTTIGISPRLRLELPKEYWPPATALADLSAAITRTAERTGSCR